MNIEKTRENLLFSIEKLKSWKKVLLDKHKEDSDEFVKLMEVMTQCVNCLSNVTSVCEKSYDFKSVTALSGGFNFEVQS